MMAVSQLLFQCFIDDKVYDGLRDSNIGGSDTTVKSAKAFSAVHMHGTLESVAGHLALRPVKRREG